MGCHTWFKTKIERSYEEAKEKWLQAQFSAIKRWEEICNNPDNEIRQAYNWTQEECNYTLKLLIRQLKVVAKGLCKAAIMNRQPDDDIGKLYFFYKGNLYCEKKDMPHDLFRVHNYPNDILLSKEETVKFIKDHNIKNVDWDNLDKFWETYPEGLIKFG